MSVRWIPLAIWGMANSTVIMKLGNSSRSTYCNAKALIITQHQWQSWTALWLRECCVEGELTEWFDEWDMILRSPHEMIEYFNYIHNPKRPRDQPALDSREVKKIKKKLRLWFHGTCSLACASQTLIGYKETPSAPTSPTLSNSNNSLNQLLGSIQWKKHHEQPDLLQRVLREYTQPTHQKMPSRAANKKGVKSSVDELEYFFSGTEASERSVLSERTIHECEVNFSP